MIISQAMHTIGLILLMCAGNSEYKINKAASKDITSPEQKKLRSSANLALLSWIGFGFYAAYWSEWYIAIFSLLFSVVLTGLYTDKIKSYFEERISYSVYVATIAGILLCLLALISF